MEALTNVALSRRWSPALYCRLVNQLRDFANVKADEAIRVLIDFVCSPQSSTVDPLLLEYIYNLSADTPDMSALLPAPLWIRKWAEDGKEDLWKGRDPRLHGLICYVARSWPTWSQDSVPTDDLTETYSAVREIVEQATAGCDTTEFLVSELARNGSLQVLFTHNPQWKQELKDVCLQKGSKDLASKIMVGNSSVKTEGGDSGTASGLSAIGKSVTALSYLPSRTLRLLWLDWLVRSAMAPPLKFFKRQLDVNWPQDRTLVVAYEATVTAFDCYATAPEFRKELWETFITKKLPLLLEELTKYGEDERLDGALSRVFTTMDKNLAAVADSNSLRVKLGQACSDMGVCDPTVLHALHISYTPVPEPELVIDPSASLAENLQKLPSLGPRSHQKLAYHILKSSGLTTDSHKIAELCAAMIRSPGLGDQLFIHVPAVSFVQNLLSHADRTSENEEVGSGSTYADIGKFLTFLIVFVPRYASLEIVESSSWMWKHYKTRFYSMKGAYGDDLDDQQKQLLGRWILDLYGGTGGGLSDELLAPTRQVISILPSLLHQSAAAFSFGVIDAEALEGGLDYFVQPFFVPLLGSLMKSISDAVCGRVHTRAMLEIARILTQHVVQRLDQEPYAIAAIAILPQVESLLEHAAELEKENNSNASTASVAKELKALKEKLSKQENQAVAPSPIEFSGSATEALTQALDQVSSWQARPAGIPTIPMALVTAAKRTLGGLKTRSLLEKAGNDVTVAVLAIDSLQSAPGTEKLVSVKGDEAATRLAVEFSSKITEITEEAAIEYTEMTALLVAKPEPDIVIPTDVAEIKVKPDDTNANPSLGTSPMDQLDMTGLSELPDLGLDGTDEASLQLGGQLDDATAFPPPSNTVASALVTGVDSDMLDDFGYGLDIDQQPMDLAALDNAMNFG